jgi:hypothetical protein
MIASLGNEDKVMFVVVIVVDEFLLHFLCPATNNKTAIPINSSINWSKRRDNQCYIRDFNPKSMATTTE